MVADLELQESRNVKVGNLDVRRALPRRQHRTVGAWCFADHFGPEQVAPGRGADIGPHPHMGLQTVTWIITGELTHFDSLGSDQLLVPGQLNLMSAGRGVSHSEESTRQYEGTIHGIQLWIAQPDVTRFDAAAFEHHAELPMLDLADTTATVLLGEFGAVASTARRDSDLLGVELVIRSDVVVPTRSDYEYCLIVLEGTIEVGEIVASPGQSVYVPTGREEIRVRARDNARVMVLGGVPFDSDIVMWWNFVARSRDEIDDAVASWSSDDGRFGRVASSLARIDSPLPAWQPASHKSLPR